MTLFDMWERTDPDDDSTRKYIGGQIESFMYIMSGLDSEVFDFLLADRHRRLGVENWTDEITDGPNGKLD
ncbi:hypothetical protein ACFWAY_18100 [Rhodococcus sp. NPDC059968]|uniref:hypothetical protein n=1 Tax=Rhodococcus sp. NPDC059968 TaxID=3347017 RepID=UPI0036719CD8